MKTVVVKRALVVMAVGLDVAGVRVGCGLGQGR